MIVALTSRGNSAGCTTIGFPLAFELAKTGKVCVVDLKNNQDYQKLLGIKSTHCIDNLITVMGVDDKFIKLEQHLHKFDSIDVVLGTRIELSNYLLSRSDRIVDLLESLSNIYDYVLIEVPDNLLLDLRKSLAITPIHVLEQNMLLIREYNDVLKSGILDGIIIVNKLDDTVYPSSEVFTQGFPKSNLLFIGFSNKVRELINLTIRNKGKFPNKAGKGTVQFYSVIEQLASIVQRSKPKKKKSEDIDEFFAMFDETLRQEKPAPKKQPTKKVQKKKKNMFGSLFGRKKVSK